MDNKRICAMTPVENEEMIPSYEEENSCHYRLPLNQFVTGLLIFIIISMGILMWQNNTNNKLKTEEAYLISMVINLQEENLFLGYGFFPSDVGLEELRDSWIDNPCYETAHTYSDALAEVLDNLAEGRYQDVFIEIGPYVQV